MQRIQDVAPVLSAAVFVLVNRSCETVRENHRHLPMTPQEKFPVLAPPGHTICKDVPAAAHADRHRQSQWHTGTVVKDTAKGSGTQERKWCAGVRQIRWWLNTRSYLCKNVRWSSDRPIAAGESLSSKFLLSSSEDEAQDEAIAADNEEFRRSSP